jgi:hypothetical protein
LYQVKRIIEGEQPIVYLDAVQNQEERTFLLNIKRGHITNEEFEKVYRLFMICKITNTRYDNLQDYIEAQKPWKVPDLQNTTTEAFIDTWLINVRKNQLERVIFCLLSLTTTGAQQYMTLINGSSNNVCKFTTP